MKLEEFLLENIDKDENIIKNYNLLNTIKLPSQIKKFPYNILSVEVTPTYKTMQSIIKSKSLKTGGVVTVLLI